MIVSNPVSTGLNSSMNFDGMGSSQYGETNTASNVIFNGVTSFTVETWYKNPGVSTGTNSTIGDNATIVTNYRRRNGGDPNNNFNLELYSNIQPSNNIGHIAFLGTKSINRVDDNQWHHIAGIYDNSKGKSYLYIDGIIMIQ